MPTRLLATAVCAFLLVAPTISAQGDSGFDVVSIKRSSNQTPQAGVRTTPNRFTLENRPFAAAVAFAFRGDITGGIRDMPAWANNDYYNIIATTAEKHSPAEMVLMVRALLGDRAKLVTHFVSEERDGYALVRVDPTRVPAGLHKIDIDCSDPAEIAKATSARLPDDPLKSMTPCVTLNGRKVISGGQSMASLAGWIGSGLGSYAVDETGLDGYYAYTLDYSPPRPGVAAQPGDPPDLTTAVREQLGLKLVPRKYTAKILVIDRLERPTED